MSPNFITKRIQPCAGAPVHKLTCGHIVQAMTFNLVMSSKCAPNCKVVSMNTSSEPRFLCPRCFAAYQTDLYNTAKKHYAKEADTKGSSMDALREEYDKNAIEASKVTGGARKSIEFCRFVPFVEVFKGNMKLEKLIKHSYRQKVNDQTLRSCKPVE
jgi:hypothetical protein